MVSTKWGLTSNIVILGHNPTAVIRQTHHTPHTV